MRPRRGAPHAPGVDPSRRQQSQYLRRLGRVIVAVYGAEVGCELRWQETLPFLPYLQVHGVSVWAVSTSAGWRFLWNRYRSHPVTDLAGAAQALMADLGLPPRRAEGAPSDTAEAARADTAEGGPQADA